MAKEPNFISIVAYVHNNADKIESFLDVVLEQGNNFAQCELIFVDDHSSDKSAEAIKKYFKQNPSDYIVSIIKLGTYHGIEAAMNSGRDIAIGDYVYEFDSIYVDFKGTVMMDAYNKCMEGNDIVTVSTDVPLRLTSRLFYALFNRFTPFQSDINQVSFRLLSRRAINRVKSMGVDIPYRQVVYMSCGLSTAEVKYESLTGSRPARNDEKNDRLDQGIDSFIFFTNVIQRATLTMFALFTLLSIAVIVYVCIASVKGVNQGMGWTSTMLFLVLGFTGFFCLLAIIVKYLSILIGLVFKKQKYLVSDIEKVASK